MADDFELKGLIIDALATVNDPASGSSVLDAHMLESVDVADGVAAVKLSFPAGYDRDKRWELEDAVTAAVEAIAGIEEVRVLGFIAGYDADKAKAKREEAAKAAEAAASKPAAPQAHSHGDGHAHGGGHSHGGGHAHGGAGAPVGRAAVLARLEERLGD